MAIDFLHLKPLELQILDREKTVFFFPVGALEDHGDHLPLGADLFEAQGYCALSAKRLESDLPEWKSVLMPPAPLGIDPVTSSVALGVRGYVLRDWLVDSTRALMRLGFKHFVCFSGTRSPRQLTAIEDAGRIIARSGFRFGSRRAELVSALSAGTNFRDVMKQPFLLAPGEHGGARDTSVALHLFPKDVDVRYSALPKKEIPASRLLWGLQKRRGAIQGYWGNPATASAEQGQHEIEKTINDLFPKLRAVWEGANPNHLFRSWYSVFPPNKSFFKSWLLLFAVIFVLALWAVLFSQNF
jgi:creatinine amidohydrolase